MKNVIKLLSISFIIFYPLLLFGQAGVNSVANTATLLVEKSSNTATYADGITAPVLTGNELKARDEKYGTNQAGAFVYVTSAANPTSTKTADVLTKGYYYFNGQKWVSFTENTGDDDDVYLGGVLYVAFNGLNTTGTTVPGNRVIGGGNGVSYSVGSLAQTSGIGGIRVLLGDNYRVSNPSNGIFDIQFNTPFQDIYGISVNMVDAYGSGSGSIATNTAPNKDSVGRKLLTTDNTQISFISNSMIRIKTGRSDGVLSNRSITFMVVGR